jgi:hypothetical protein
MSMVETPVTILINQLAAGPSAPGAAGTPLRTRVADVVATMGPAPWARRIIADERNLVTLIASPPGGGNRPHWHREFDEWWVVLAGRLQWELTGGILVDDLSLRLAVAMPPAWHFYSPCEQCGFADDGPREWCA